MKSKLSPSAPQTSPAPSDQMPTIATDFFQARLRLDWEEFEREGRSLVGRAVPEDQRGEFRDQFLELEKAGCRFDVLLACIYVFLNSRPQSARFPATKLTFPWEKDLKAIETPLKAAREKMEALFMLSGIATLRGQRGVVSSDLMDSLRRSMAVYSDEHLREEASAVSELSRRDVFEAFFDSHLELLMMIDEYLGELQKLFDGLPRRDVINRYGHAVAVIYTGIATKLSFAQQCDLISVLLQCFYGPGRKRGLVIENWGRDINEFHSSYPLFWERAKSFLITKHKTKLRMLPLDWDGFVQGGTF